MIRNVFLALLALLVVVISAAFAWMNPGAISLDLGFGILDTTISYAFIACFALGWLVGILTLAFWAFRQARQRRKLARQLRLAEAEVANLRQLTTTDDV